LPARGRASYNASMPKPLVVFLHSDSYDRVYQCVNILLTASSMGRTCYLFLFYGALGSLVAGAWDDEAWSGYGEDAEAQRPWARTLARRFELSDTPSPRAVLDRARSEPGGVKVLACSNSVQLLGLEPAAVKRSVDEIVGLSTMLEISGGDCQVFYI